jgi:hypothetical protein
MDSARQAAQEYLNNHHLNSDELWRHYWSNGGETLSADFAAYLAQVPDPPEGEQQVLTWALHELMAADGLWLAPPRVAARVPGPGILP